MKKTLLLLPLFLLVVSCSSEEQKAKQVCSRLALQQESFDSLDAAKELGVTGKPTWREMMRYCEFYK